VARATRGQFVFVAASGTFWVPLFWAILRTSSDGRAHCLDDFLREGVVVSFCRAPACLLRRKIRRGVEKVENRYREGSLGGIRDVYQVLLDLLDAEPGAMVNEETVSSSVAANYKIKRKSQQFRKRIRSSIDRLLRDRSSLVSKVVEDKERYYLIYPDDVFKDNENSGLHREVGQSSIRRGSIQSSARFSDLELGQISSLIGVNVGGLSEEQSVEEIRLRLRKILAEIEKHSQLKIEPGESGAPVPQMLDLLEWARCPFCPSPIKLSNFERHINDHRKKTRKRSSGTNTEDGPSTIYECPVCEAGIALRDIKSHLAKHETQGEISAEMEDLVYGLEWVADKVMASTNDRSKSKAVKKTKKKRNRGPKSLRTFNAATTESILPAYGSGSQDLFKRNRPFSGGGANGTGKRR